LGSNAQAVMPDDLTRLRRYSRNQLIEELARRANERDTRKTPEHWCHDCSHFVAWCEQVPAPRKDCPDEYNPCTKGHAMRFMAPEEIDDEYGFYLAVCADRDLLPNVRANLDPTAPHDYE